jgi:hypothetical protein
MPLIGVSFIAPRSTTVINLFLISHTLSIIVTYVACCFLLRGSKTSACVWWSLNLISHNRSICTQLLLNQKVTSDDESVVDLYHLSEIFFFPLLQRDPMGHVQSGRQEANIRRGHTVLNTGMQENLKVIVYN